MLQIYVASTIIPYVLPLYQQKFAFTKKSCIRARLVFWRSGGYNSFILIFKERL